MIKTMRITVALALAVSFYACNTASEKKTPSGLTYTVVSEGEGEVAKNGEYLVLNMIYKDENDSVWVDTQDRGVPMVIVKEDSVWLKSEGSIEQVFLDLKIGDSVHFDIKTADLFEKTWKAPIPPNVDSAGMITFQVGVEEVLDQEGFATWRQEMMAKQQQMQAEEAEKQLQEDVDIIDQYLSENNIEAEETESGLRYVITEEGAGAEADAGDKVMVSYAGYVLNGEYFDTSIESVAKEQGLYNEQRTYEPFELTLGQGSVIKGWDEGLTYLQEGDKATLYIPSPMAYGARARSEVIKANSILVFDVELVSVEDAENTEDAGE